MDPDNEEQTETPEPVDTSTDAADDKTDAGKEEPGTALDAVNAALEAEAPKPAAEDDETKEGEEDAAAPDAAKPDAAAKPGEAKAEAKPGEPPAVVEPPPPGDAVNDPIDPHVKGKTRERMTALIGTVKEATAERDRYLGERDELVGMIQSTRATPEQYGQALDYLKAVNSGDPAQIRLAIKTAQQELHALASMIGEPVPGVDMLAAHADLQAAVQAGDLNAEHAQEIAAARALRSVQQAQGQRATEFSQGQVAIDQGKAALNQLETQLRADPHYAAKRQMLIPVLQPILAQLPPDKWAGAFRAAYEKLPAPVAPVAAPPRPAVPHNQPLRAKQPAGSSAKQPASMLDALSEGIERAARR